MTLDDHIAALRAEGESDDGAAAQATRLRLRRSLDHGGVAHRGVVSVAAALAVLFVATASWALATGHLQSWLRRTEHVLQPPRMLPHAAAPAPAPRHEATTKLEQQPEPAPPEAPPPVTAPAVKPARHAAARPAAQPVEALYRTAHELHFHGHDHAAALAAWDAYLAAEPAGRFAVEARYNRAMCLVRLGRLDEARTALAPFAHGEVEPAGYRQDEARALVDRIDGAQHD